MVVQNCNPDSWGAEAGGSGVQSQPGLHSETLFQKQSKTTTKMKIMGTVGVSW